MATKGIFSFGNEDKNTCLHCDKELNNQEIELTPFSIMQSMFCNSECKIKFDINHK